MQYRPSKPQAPLSEFDRYCLTLRLAAPIVLPFEHGGVLRGLLSRALSQHQLPDGLILFAAESGRVHFRAGDRYRWVVTLVGEARGQAETLLAGIAAVGGRVDKGPAPVLGGNFVLEATDLLPAVDLDAELAQLGERDEIVLLLRSPLCLPRPKTPQGARGGIFDQHCFPAAAFLDRLWRRRFFLQHSRYPRPEERSTRAAVGEGATARPHHLLAVDLPVRGTGEHKPSYNLAGVRGQVVFGGLSEEERSGLVAGMFLHLGKSVNFGFGRYTLEGTLDHGDKHFLPSTSLLAHAADSEVLEDAVAHLRQNLKTKHQLPGDEDEPIPGRLIVDLSRRLLDGSYQPGLLSGFVLPKKDGGVRPLAVPSVRDRVAQRAAIEVLAPIIDGLLEDSSFGYRRGFSRQGAARAIERAYAEGYRYVLDADIHAFFDQVDWSLLFAKLEALFPQEPLVELLRQWIQAPVIFEGRRIRRQRGLPQGSPISPLLANLYLDQLDEALIDQGFRLVRFADDFVVLTKDLDRARAAKLATERVLRELRLSLNQDETAIRAIDDGFSYLGYLFVRSMVIEKRSSSSADGSAAEVSLDADDVPAGSWLAGVSLRRIEELLSGRRGPKSVAGFERVPLATGAALDAGRWPLYVVGHDTRLFLRRRTVVLKRPEQEPAELPIEALSHVVFWGRVRATVPVLRGLARAGVPAYFCQVDGTLEAVFGPYEEKWPNWLAQARAADNPELCLRFAMATIEARLRNLRSWRCALAGAAVRRSPLSCASWRGKLSTSKASTRSVALRVAAWLWYLEHWRMRSTPSGVSPVVTADRRRIRSTRCSPSATACFTTTLPRP